MTTSCPCSDPLLARCAALLQGRNGGDLSAEDARCVRALSDSHGIAGLLYEALSGHVPSVGWGDLRDQLAAGVHHLAAWNLAQESEIRRVCARLQSEGFRLILLKGVPLALRHYPGSHLRPRADCDLFVDPTQIAEARHCLQALGYRCEPLIEPLRKGQYLATQFNATREDDKGFSMTFDVHWQVSNNLCYARALPFDELYRRAVALDLDGCQTYCPHPVDSLIIACLHWTTEHKKKLIWLYDMLLLAESLDEGDRRQCIERLREKSLSSIVRCSLELVTAIFESDAVTALIGSIDDSPRAGIVERILRRDPAGHLPTRIAEWLSLPWRERIFMILVLAFPPPQYFELQSRPGGRAARLRRLFGGAS